MLEFVDPDTAESVRMTLAAGAQGECFGRAGEPREELLERLPQLRRLRTRVLLEQSAQLFQRERFARRE